MRSAASIILVLGASLSCAAESLETTLHFESCNDYHCDIRKPVSLSIQQWQQLQRLFTTAANPAEERQQIGRAIARFEQWVGKQTGSWRDLPGNDGEGSEAGQLDCIAESINTTTYLQLMAQHNLLKWHRVGARERRNPWIFNIHWTATIQETMTGRRFAVDSWFFANGKPPVIQPIEAWSRGLEQTVNQP